MIGPCYTPLSLSPGSRLQRAPATRSCDRGVGAMLFRLSPTNVVNLRLSFDYPGVETAPDQSPRSGKTTLATSPKDGAFANVSRIHLLRLEASKRTITVITTRYRYIPSRPPPHFFGNTLQQNRFGHRYPALIDGIDGERVRTRARGGAWRDASLQVDGLS
ncbi:hypothetical protein T484DRAFT_2020685 [Baffinella frigidus]|nr:hypothetical protein T484DRAFT_2020685 [Cryptophyta sp. CCMP2293]